MQKTFEEFLNNKHADQYKGIKDNMSDDFNNWSEQLETEEIIEYVKEYTQRLRVEIKREIFISKLGDRIYIPMPDGKKQIWELKAIEEDL